MLFVLAVVAYIPVWKAGYIWDDPEFLTENKCIIGPKGLWDIWTSREARICPLTLTTYWLLHGMWGLNPLPYHVVTVIFHAANAVILWRVLGQLRIPGAWLGAAFWMLHPVQVESVAWVTEMRNTQSGLFFLLAVFAFTRVLDVSSTTQRRDSALVILFSALAMASKSSTVVLPIVLALCAWRIEGKWNLRHAKLLSWIFLLAIITSAVSIWTQSNEPRLDLVPHTGVIERVLLAAAAVFFYLGKLLWPHPLVAVYPRIHIDVSQISSWLPLIALVVAFIVLMRWRRAWPVLLALLYFVIALLPVLGFANHTFLYYTTVADRFQYLASIGPLALGGAALAQAQPFLQQTLGAALISVLGIMTWQNSEHFQSQEKLWGHNLEHDPNCWVAYNVSAYAKQENGQIQSAIADWQKALTIFPDDFQAHLSLGILLRQTGQKAEANEHARRAVELSPRHAPAHNNVANGLRESGQIAEAIAEYEKAALLAPDNISSASNLAWVLATCPDSRLRDPIKAVASAERANLLAGTPNPALIRLLAAAYASAGRYADAEQAANFALTLISDPRVMGLRVKLEIDLDMYRKSKPVIDENLTPKP